MEASAPALGSPVLAMRGRIGAARLALGGVVDKSSVAFNALSAAQASSLCDFASRTSADLSPDDRALLVPMIVGVGFQEDHLTAILATVIPHVGDAPGKRARRKQQDWTNFTGYFSAEHWDVLLDPGCNSASKQELVFAVCSATGLRLVSETTKKRFASFNLAITHDWDKAISLPMATKKLMAHTLGDAFTSFVASAGEPKLWIQKLPPDPAEMKRRYPEMYAAFYVDGREPILPKVDSLRLQMLDDSFRCRGLGGGRRRTVRRTAPKFP